MRAVGYIRVSTEEQATDGVSLDAQRAKLAAYAALYDIELVEIVADAGVSAKSLDRPGLQTALAMLRNGSADGLLVAKLDRLSRSVGDWDALIKGYFGERAGKQLFSVADAIDTRTAAGRLVLNILMSVAQWEREAIGERTADAMRHKTRNGERTTRTKFGFDVGADGVKLVPNAAEQAVIARILAMRTDGQSYRAIATRLNAEGIATKERGRRWEPMTVSRILNRKDVQTCDVHLPTNCGNKSTVAA